MLLIPADPFFSPRLTRWNGHDSSVNKNVCGAYHEDVDNSQHVGINLTEWSRDGQTN